MNKNIAIAILVILYAVGVAGIRVFNIQNFILLTPLNLLVCLSIVLFCHPKWTFYTVLTLLAAAFGGWAVEVYGVATDALFGSYRYGATLGWKYQNVPVAMGINWATTIYCVGILINHGFERWHFVLKSTLGAAVAVSLDLLLEPVAMRYDFWQWQNNTVPTQNYLAWAVVSFIFLSIFNLLQGNIKNKVAIALLILQFTFFAILQ